MSAGLNLRIANIEDFGIAAMPIKRTFSLRRCCYLYLLPITKNYSPWASGGK
jgi:hypothetical protein